MFLLDYLNAFRYTAYITMVEVIFMESSKPAKKRVCVMLTPPDHERLSRLAAASGRTLPGYLRWLLHRHFREKDRHAPD